MANKVLLKKSSVVIEGVPKAPLPEDLDYGELAINYAAGRLYYKKADNTIDSFSSATTTSTVSSVDGNTGDITAQQLLDAVKKVDGSGSGLDSDLLDGLSSASYAKSGANADITSLTGVTGGISTADYIDFDSTATVTPQTGRIWWDGADDQKTLSIGMADGVVQQVGQETYFRIKATAPITNGQVVMFTGTVGSSGALTGAPAAGLTPETGIYVMGIATQDIPLNGWGYVTNFGLVRGINTTGGGEGWTDGTILYYNPTVTGGLTKTIPTAPNPKVMIAAVVHAASNGSVFVRVNHGSVLGGTDGNVQFGTLANGNLISYNGTNARWENVAQSTITSGDSDKLDGQHGSYYLDWTNTTNKPDPVITVNGDASGSVTLTDLASGTLSLTLANSGVTAGSYGDANNIPSVTVDSKGRVTTISTTAVNIPSGSLSFTGDVTGTGNTGSTTTLTLANSGVTAGIYTKITVDSKGRVTSGASLASGDLPTYTGTLTSSQITTGLGYTPENSANKGVANGYASLDSGGKVPSAQLPSYVDDVLEYANLAAFPATGETAKIYVALDTNKTYRWSGSAYVEISPSPGTTDSLTEGSTNLYFTTARARSSISATQNITYDSATGVITGPNLSSYLTGNQTITVSGDASGSGTTSISLTLANSGVTAGTYNDSATAVRPFTVDAKGRVTSIGTAVTITPDWSSITSKPTTLSGYGITDAASSTHTHSYLPLSGGTVSGYSTFTSGLSAGSGTGQRIYSYVSGNIRQGLGVDLNGLNYNSAWFGSSGSSNQGTLSLGFVSSSDGASFSEIVRVNAAGGMNVMSGALQQGGNQVLHAGNYNSYAPTLTGTGASGTWGISVTGSAGSVAWSGVTSKPTTLSGYGITDSITVPDGLSVEISGADLNTKTATGFYRGSSMTNAPDTGWWYVMVESHDNNSNGANGWTKQTATAYGAGNSVTAGTTYVRVRTGSTTWNGWVKLVDAGNYNSYAPTLTGTGASGTWGINVTGNAATVTVNYNNDSNSTYQMLWGSGNSVYGTAGIYCNPSIDTVYAANFDSTSDIRYKTDIELISDPLAKVQQLNGYTFTLTETGVRSTGVIAQELEPVLPEAVHGTSDKKTVSYGNLVGLLIEAIKAQQVQINELRALIETK